MLSTVPFLFISTTIISAQALIKSCILYISYLLNEIASSTTCYIYTAARVISYNTVFYHFSLNTLDDSPVAQKKKPKVLRPSSGSKISFQTYLLRSFCTFYISVYPTSQALQKCFSLSYQSVYMNKLQKQEIFISHLLHARYYSRNWRHNF